MKNTLGNSVTLTLFGESHGEAVGAVIDGIAPGIEVDEEEIKRMLSRRRPSSSIDTARVENDNFRILSGVFGGKTTGSPLCIVIPNENVKSGDYSYGAARPSHADYTAFCKYHGFEDYRGGGHFSGRVTAALVAAGGILLPALEKKGITVGTHILACKSARDRDFENAEEDIKSLKNADFPVLDKSAGDEMIKIIEEAKQNGDSIGGIISTAVCGLPAGLGEPWFDSVEGALSRALFGIGAVKGVEFGAGFDVARMRGSESNDPFTIAGNRVITTRNVCGGILGGISDGMPIILRAAVKPTPSISQEQHTVDLKEQRDAILTVGGRHDPCIVPRALPAIESAVAIGLAELMKEVGRL
jgi:chorismate synthase